MRNKSTRFIRFGGIKTKNSLSADRLTQYGCFQKLFSFIKKIYSITFST